MSLARLCLPPSVQLCLGPSPDSLVPSLERGRGRSLGHRRHPMGSGSPHVLKSIWVFPAALEPPRQWGSSYRQGSSSEGPADEREKPGAGSATARKESIFSNLASMVRPRLQPVGEKVTVQSHESHSIQDPLRLLLELLMVSVPYGEGHGGSTVCPHTLYQSIHKPFHQPV